MTTLLTMKGFNKQIDYLCFTANTAGSTVKLNKWAYAPSNNFEISNDGIVFTDYTAGSTITLTNIWDKVYFRNKSETPSNIRTGNPNWYWYYFSMTWSIAASGDCNFMLCKNSTDTLFNYCFSWLFAWCAALTSAPKLPATTLKQYCYYNMFANCSNIKLSATQTWEYQNEYRIPTTWTWTTATDALTNMFNWTWWTFKWTPTINTTYYTSNTVV